MSDEPGPHVLAPEEVAFRLRVARDPLDTVAKMAFRDWLQESDDQFHRDWGEFMTLDERIAKALAESKRALAENHGWAQRREVQEARKQVSPLRDRKEKLQDAIRHRATGIHCLACRATGRSDSPSFRIEDIAGEEGGYYVRCPACGGSGTIDGLSGRTFQYVDGLVTDVWFRFADLFDCDEDGMPRIMLYPSKELVGLFRWHPVTTIVVTGPLQGESLKIHPRTPMLENHAPVPAIIKKAIELASDAAIEQK